MLLTLLMLLYEKTEMKILRVAQTNKGKLMLFSKFAVCDSKKSEFIKQQEASGILSSLGLKTPSSKIPVLANILF